MKRLPDHPHCAYRMRSGPTRRHPSRALTPLALALLTTLAACSGDDATSPDSDEALRGVWVLEEMGSATFYVDVEEDRITTYTTYDVCWIETVFVIVDRDGDVYTLQQESTGSAFQTNLSVEAGQLHITGNGVTTTLSAVTFDPNGLSTCADEPGSGGGGAACASLTLIGVGITGGDLEQVDDVAGGYYYDLYRLQIASETTVIVTLISSDFDTYLLLYNDAGSLIEIDDDDGEGFNSEISRTLSPGCYRVEVTGYYPNSLGEYSLTVTTD